MSASPPLRAEALRENAPLDASSVARLMARVARCVAEAHATGQAHGALQPSAIELTLRGDEVEVEVRGFGEPPPANWRYRAPELQTPSARPTPASDVWSLGVLAYELLTGALPDSNDESVEETATTLAAAPLRKIAPWVDDALIRVVERALSARPGDRPADARALEEEFRGVAEGTGPLTLAGLGLDSRTSDLPSVASAHTVQASPQRRADADDASLAHLVGESLDGRYQLTELLGEGGMGSVFAARDSNGREVAIKVIRPDSKIRDAVRRFAREARSTMKVESPHVVQVFEVATEGDLPYMVMERLHGRDLGEVLKEVGPLEPSAAARLFVDACRGLAAAHAKGIVHRDIKPGNLFLHEDEHGAICVKVCDFGVVKQQPLSEDHSTALTHTGGILGTPSYMSPEQAQDSKSVDARSDIWSLCMSLYATLAGKPAWHALSNVGEVMVALYTKSPPPLQDSAPWVSPELAAVVHRGLMRNREERLSSADELAGLLEPLAAPAQLKMLDLRGVLPEQRKLVAERATLPGEQAGKGPSTHRARWVAGSVAVLMLAGAGLAWRASSRAIPAQEPSATNPGCSSAKACTSELGAAARCRTDGRCVALASPLCHVEAEQNALDSDDTVWIGTMFPVDHSIPYMVEFGRASQNAVLLATREIMSVAGGLPPLGKGSTRPLGIVACSDAKDPRAAATHLVEAQVPAVIGFGSSQSVVELSTSLFLQSDVLVVPSMNGSSLISSIPHPQGSPHLVWRTTGSTTGSARGLAHIVSDYLEADIRKATRVRSSVPLRLGLVARHSSSSLARSAELQKALRFNGKSVTENGERFREFRLLGDNAGKLLRDELTVSDVIDFQPHILVFGDVDDTMVQKVLEPLESRWPAELKPRPRYLMSSSLEEGALTKALLKHPDLAQRVLGLSSLSVRPANLTFISSYNATYGTRYLPTEAPSAPYDAAYFVAYALAVAKQPPGGSSLARAVPKLLPPGERVQVGPMAFLKAVRLLSEGKPIDLDGAFSGLDFDPKTGDTQVDYSVVCAGVRNGKLYPHASGLVYESAKDALTGKFDCSDPGPR
ncbi:MAG: serine/threonine-protein kinase [Polyangiaceae bacterium]